MGMESGAGDTTAFGLLPRKSFFYYFSLAALSLSPPLTFSIRAGFIASIIILITCNWTALKHFRDLWLIPTEQKKSRKFAYWQVRCSWDLCNLKL